MITVPRAEIELDPGTGLVGTARQIASPNCDDRPADCEPELIIIHGISLPPGHFGGEYVDRFFTNRLRPEEHEYFREIAELRVSAHFLIRRSGDLVQYVPVHRRAWHAGDSCFDGRNDCNDFSVGIELEGTDDINYEEAQYMKLAELVAALMRTCPSLSTGRIVGHSDVAPGRKSDPGPAFNWKHFRRLLRHLV